MDLQKQRLIETERERKRERKIAREPHENYDILLC